jgi:esterase
MLKPHIPDTGTRQFIMKSLYWVEPGQLGWRFNLPVFNDRIDNIGEALPEEAVFTRPALFLRGENSGYISERDQADIERHFPDSEIVVIPRAGHWLHAENPDAFFSETLRFLNSGAL